MVVNFDAVFRCHLDDRSGDASLHAKNRFFSGIGQIPLVWAYNPSIEDFWEVMETPPSCRKDFKALRVRVIEPAVEAIRTKCGGWSSGHPYALAHEG